MPQTLDEAVRDLTAPGARFEMETVEIRGVPTKAFRQRLRSLRELARLACDKRAESELLVHGDTRLTYREFFRLASSAARRLELEHRLAPGDRIAILSANNTEWCVAFWAALNAGAVAVPLNGWWKTDEILYGLEDSGARILVVDRERLARIRDEIGGLPGLDAVYVIDPAPGDLDSDVRLHDAAELMAEPTENFPTSPIDEDDPAVIMYTSGTTGRPKGAVATHRSWLASTHNLAAMAALVAAADPDEGPASTRSDVRMVCVPLFHVSGSQGHLVAGLGAGWKLVLPEGRFEPERILTLIENERVTAWTAVPTMVSRVCRHPDRHRFDLSSVTSVGYGGAPVPTELGAAVRETFPNVRYQANIYGLTETSGAATLNGGRSHREKPGSVGRGLLTVDVEIRDTDGRPLPAGETGEICIRGPLVVAGYWNRPEETAQTIVDGWLHTGDVGYLDSEGFLYVTDRAKDVIIRGGENVYCVEIEDRLCSHPGVFEAAVAGVPHPDLGESVKAWVCVAPGSDLTQAELQRWTAETLADFKVPSEIEIRTEPLPRNAAGKILKTALRPQD